MLSFEWSNIKVSSSHKFEVRGVFFTNGNTAYLNGQVQRSYSYLNVGAL